MIFCVLLNPTIDTIIRISDFKAGGTFKAETVEKFPVGKGISVALTLRELGESPQVIALIGRNEIPIYEKFLAEKDINAKLIAVDGITRRNTTIIDPVQHHVTHIRFPGFQVQKDVVDEIVDFLDEKMQDDDILVLSGSIPRDLDFNDINRIISVVADHDSRYIIDTSGEPLAHIKELTPLFIKANIAEMNKILGQNLIDSTELGEKPELSLLKSMAKKCKKLLNEDIKFVTLTLGDYGALMINRQGVIYGFIKIEDVDYTVGCGDAFLGGLIFGIVAVRSYSIERIFKLALACGAANTKMIGAGLLEKTTVTGFLDVVNLQKID